MIELLPQAEWKELEPLLALEFDATVPNLDKAVIVVDRAENGEIVGFVIMEMLLRVGQIYSAGGARPKAMLDYIESTIGPETSVIAIASEPRFESTCEKFKMRRVPGVVYRRDF